MTCRGSSCTYIMDVCWTKISKKHGGVVSKGPGKRSKTSYQKHHKKTTYATGSHIYDGKCLWTKWKIFPQLEHYTVYVFFFRKISHLFPQNVPPFSPTSPFKWGEEMMKPWLFMVILYAPAARMIWPRLILVVLLNMGVIVWYSKTKQMVVKYEFAKWRPRNYMIPKLISKQLVFVWGGDVYLWNNTMFWGTWRMTVSPGRKKYPFPIQTSQGLKKRNSSFKGQLGVPLTVYPWNLLCSLGILGDYNP